MSFFDFVNSINDTKKDLIKEDPMKEKEYVPFMVNRALSLFSDTILHANEMNQHVGIPADWQYHFYLSAISKKKRFSKWPKKEAQPDVLKLIMKEYNYSESKALSVYDLFSEEQLKELQEKYFIGGSAKQYK